MRLASIVNLSRERAYLRDLGRAFAGALIFSIPMLMTMEMWEQGVSMGGVRMLLFFATGLPLLYGLAYYAGFSDRRGLRNDILDTAVALAVGFITAGILLMLFGLIPWDSSPRDAMGRVALQAVPAAMGALLARRQLSGGGDEGDEDEASYFGELFLMTAGALFFALNVAPTEEVILIAYKTTPVHTLSLLIASVILLHLIVFNAGFAGQEESDKPVQAFFHFTLPGYAIALGISLFTLYLFGRVDGHSVDGIVQACVVLGLPASVGAAAARLLV